MSNDFLTINVFMMKFYTKFSSKHFYNFFKDRDTQVKDLSPKYRGQE